MKTLSVDTDAFFTSFIRQQGLPDKFITTINKIYFPLAEIIVNKKDTSPLLVSINGVQGSGKSTLTFFLKKIIESTTNHKVLEFSIDDFYLTRHQRHQLAKEVHPLFSTRGVPGTHDISLLENVLDDLSSHRSCFIPRFDKSIDDRFSESHWTKVDKPVDIILFEGWCNNSPAQEASELVAPLNELEANEDVEGVWRHYVNNCLSDYHQRIFDHTDLTIMLNSFSFERVYQWRRLQEKKLQLLSSSKNKSIMNDETLLRFIQHYERISRHTLQCLPEQTDVMLAVEENHCISAIHQKK